MSTMNKLSVLALLSLTSCTVQFPREQSLVTWQQFEERLATVNAQQASVVQESNKVFKAFDQRISVLEKKEK